MCCPFGYSLHLPFLGNVRRFKMFTYIQKKKTFSGSLRIVAPLYENVLHAVFFKAFYFGRCMFNLVVEKLYLGFQNISYKHISPSLSFSQPKITL
jgi:hypothetical protein